MLVLTRREGESLIKTPDTKRSKLLLHAIVMRRRKWVLKRLTVREEARNKW